jgi:hypothetical protein
MFLFYVHSFVVVVVVVIVAAAVLVLYQTGGREICAHR